MAGGGETEVESKTKRAKYRPLRKMPHLGEENKTSKEAKKFDLTYKLNKTS